MPGFTTRPEIRGTFGVVATTHWLASAVAMGVLETGGNAFDAAVAAGFTLQVVEPHLNGPLGDAPILAYSAKNRRCDVICGQGGAPAAATIAISGASGSTSFPAPAFSQRRSPAPSTRGCGSCAITGRWRFPS